MAKIYGQKNEYLIRGDKKNLIIARIFTVIFIIFYVCGVIFLLNYKRHASSYWIAIFAFFLFWFVADKFLNKSNHFYHGRMAESFILHKLSQLPIEYSIYYNIKVPTKQGNIDCVVLGPTGIFTIEVKGNSGVIGFDGTKLKGEKIPPEKDFLKQALFEALSLHDYIKTELNRDFFVKPVLVFSSYNIEFKFSTGLINKVFVTNQRDLLKFITEQERFLSTDIIFSLENVLIDLINNK